MSAVLRQIKTSLGRDIDLAIFFFLAGWNVTAAIRMNRFYQDSWILDGLWISLFLLLSAYILIVSRRSDLQQIALVTFITTCLLNVLPALKYTYSYLPTSDVATHLSFSSSIANTGRLASTTVYSATPGFHVLAAIFSQISGIKDQTILKIMPGLIGSLVPLCTYIFCKRTGMPVDLAKWVISLSGLSLPILYGLNGTSFTAPIFICLLIFFVLRVINSKVYGVQYTLINFLLILQILFWHPSTSFIYPIYFLSVGLLSFAFPKMRLFPPRAQSYLSTGILVAVSTLTYWMYNAQNVWSHFLVNLKAAIAIERDVAPNLIPTRLFQISLTDKVIVALFYHARDGLFIFIALLGLVLLIRAKDDTRLKDPIKFIAVVFIASLALLAGIFVIEFGSQGYQRFLMYSVALSPIIGGYGLWKIGEHLKRFVPRWNKFFFPFFLTSIISISLIQLYPYQDIVPSVSKSSFDRHLSPMVWIHQVNTEYQHQMLQYAFIHLRTDDQVLTDYMGTRQENIFLGLEPEWKLRSWLNAKPQPAIVLLHWPGPAGGFQDKLELRSMDQIDLIQTHPSMNTIYDNGYSFILFYPYSYLQITAGK